MARSILRSETNLVVSYAKNLKMSDEESMSIYLDHSPAMTHASVDSQDFQTMLVVCHTKRYSWNPLLYRKEFAIWSSNSFLMPDSC